MVAVPSIGRASQVTPRRAAPEADATRELYERYARQIYSYCLHQLGNREEAEDATQSTFLNAFRGLQRGVDPEFESAWLYKIAQNVCLTRQRSSSRRRRVETPGDLEAMQDYVPAHQADSDELIHLPEALESMPEQQRRALLLREWQGLSYKEIAEELDVSQAAVETLLFRARRTLANELVEAPPKKASAAARRLRRSGDAGSLLAILKSVIFAGGTKVAAATVATVAATSVVATSPATRHAVEAVVAPAHDLRTPAHHVARPAPKKPVVAHVAAPAAAAVVARSVASSRPAVIPRPAAVSRPRPIALRRTSRPVHIPAHVGPAHVRVVKAAHPVVPAAAAPVPAATPAPPGQVDPAPPAPAPVEPTPVAPTPAPVVASAPKKEDSGKGHDDERHGGKGDHGHDAPARVPAPVEPTPAAAPTPVPTLAPAATPSEPTTGSDDGDGRHGGKHGDDGAHHERAAAEQTAADTSVQPAPVPTPAAPAPAPAPAAVATPPTPVTAPDASSNQSDDADHGHGHHGGGHEK